MKIADLFSQTIKGAKDGISTTFRLTAVED